MRFICGTFEPHLELEAELADFVGTEAALTYASCWNANEAVIPTLTDENTVLISDELNHASIVDAMRLAKPARKVVYTHSDMDELRDALRACEPGQRKIVVTDGVFSMEGDLARLPEIVELAREHDAIVIVDDSHGTGVMGATGRGVAEHFGLLGEIDVITSTLGKALGGAAGGFVASSREVCDLLSQRSRPQLFSNAIPPPVACGALAAVRTLRSQPELVQKLHASTETFRGQLAEAGFQPLPGEAAIIPIIVGDTAFAIEVSRRLLEQGVFVTGLRLSGRAGGSGARPRPDVRRARAGAPRPRTGGLREGRPGSGPPGRPGLAPGDLADPSPRPLGLADRSSRGGGEIAGFDLGVELLALLELEAQVVDLAAGTREREHRLEEDKERVEHGQRSEGPEVG